MTPTPQVTNVFTVDLEEWHHANYEGVEAPAEIADDLVIGETQQILDLLAATSTHATFFVLGETASKYPDLVRKVASAGHEIASHSLSHDLVYKMSREEFRIQATRSKALLEELTGSEVLGYRAPSWSVGPKTPWFWEELAAAGYRYSSSLFPFATPLYGDKDTRFAHRRDGIVEIPPTTAQILGKRLPFSGGFYLRAAPGPIISGLTKRVNREREAVIYYIHPREVDPDQPRLSLGPLHRTIHYYGIKSTLKKLRRILDASTFSTMADAFVHDGKVP